MILIGSKAVRFWFSDFPRNPKDTDYIVCDLWEKDLHNKQNGIEYLVNPVLYQWYGDKAWEQPLHSDHLGAYICEPNELYTLKISHAIGWKLENGTHEKHLWDINWLKNKGCTLIMPLFWDLYNYWNEVNGENKRSDLEMTSEDFFDNALECPYSHDWLHTLINPIPTYTKVLKDGAEVEVSEEKFNLLTEEEKEALVREEVYIMAFERYLKLDYPFAYYRMLKKFLWNHAPIWEALWMIQNWPKLVKAKFNFIEYLNEKVRNPEIVRNLTN